MHRVHIAIVRHMMNDIPMTQGQRNGYCEQRNEHMYHKVHIELTARLLLIVLADGNGNETVGGGHHDGVDDAYEGDDAGNDRIQSVVTYTQCLQTETCVEQTADGYNGESDVKYERVYRYRFVRIFLHLYNIEFNVFNLISVGVRLHPHTDSANSKATKERRTLCCTDTSPSETSPTSTRQRKQAAACACPP